MNFKPLSVQKKTLIWLWTAVNHFSPGILAWVLGDRSAETFKPLWRIVYCWHSYFYITDGYKVYQSFIEDAAQIVDKTYMTRVESENTRLRHYLARLHRKTLCYSRVSRYAEVFDSLVTPLSQISHCACTELIHPCIQQRPKNGANARRSVWCDRIFHEVYSSY